MNSMLNCLCKFNIGCSQKALNIKGRLDLGYRPGIEHLPLCKKHTLMFLNREISATSEEDFRRTGKIIAKGDNYEWKY